MKKPGAEAPGSIRLRAFRGVRSSEMLGVIVLASVKFVLSGIRNIERWNPYSLPSSQTLNAYPPDIFVRNAK